MATEKRLIDVNVPIRDLTAMKSMYDAISLDGIIKGLKDAPTVDAVEVVHCEDCFADGCCSIQIDLDMGGHGYCPKGRRTDGNL